MADKKLEKITIIRSTVFDGEVRAEGDVCDVTDINRKDADYLVRKNKAVEGAVGRNKPANRAMSGADLDKK